MDLRNIEQTIESFWRDRPLNTVEELDRLQILSRPLIGVAQAQDELVALRLTRE